MRKFLEAAKEGRPNMEAICFHTEWIVYDGPSNNLCVAHWSLDYPRGFGVTSDYGSDCEDDGLRNDWFLVGDEYAKVEILERAIQTSWDSNDYRLHQDEEDWTDEEEGDDSEREEEETTSNSAEAIHDD
jgi:hypothetical protein